MAWMRSWVRSPPGPPSLVMYHNWPMDSPVTGEYGGSNPLVTAKFEGARQITPNSRGCEELLDVVPLALSPFVKMAYPTIGLVL